MKRVKTPASGTRRLAVAVLAALVGCASKDAPKRKPAPVVSAERAVTAHIAEVVETTGDVVAVRAATLSATVEGPIGSVRRREGDTVKTGELLVEIDRASYRAEVAVARAAVAVARAKLADIEIGVRPEEIAQAREAVRQAEEAASFAEADLRRISRLVESGSLPGEMLEKNRVEHVAALSRLASARERLSMLEAGPTRTQLAVQRALVQEGEARLGLAEARIAECRIVAPFDGIVSRVHVAPGDMATARAPLVEMYDPESLVVRFALPEHRSGPLGPGSQVEFAPDALGGARMRAKVVRVFPEINRPLRTRTFEATPEDVGRLAPGMFVRIKAAVRTEREAIVVPSGAVITTPRGEHVVFVVKDGKVSRREVETGIRDAGRTQIVSGLAPGEFVVTVGNEGLADGVAVGLAGRNAAADPARDKTDGGNR
jgi:HlyD family secretion protein